jgi:hypothetical protein
MIPKTMPLSGGDYILDEKGLRRAESPAPPGSAAEVGRSHAADAPATPSAPSTVNAPAAMPTPRPTTRARTQRATPSS